MYKIILVLLLGLLPFSNNLDDITFGKEICDNGIDDDLNGFVDCFDEECDCSKLCENNYYSKCDTGCILDNKESSFEMQLKWESNSNIWHEYNIPIIADLDGDGSPEIIGKTGPHQGRGWPQYVKDFQIFDGVTGQHEATFVTPYMHYKFSAPAVGDVDKNGTPEIFYITGFTADNNQQGRLICFEFQNGSYRQKWVADRGIDPNSYIGSQGPPGIADFNQDGIPEVYIGHHIFNAVTGKFLTSGKVSDNFGNYERTRNAHSPSFVVAADVLDDNFCTHCTGLELIAGNQVFSVNIAGNTGNINVEVTGQFGADGFTSIADMDRDGDLDAVVIWKQNNRAYISVWDLQTPQGIGSTYSVNNQFGNNLGLANIADFNGDGFPEIGFTTSSTYRVLGFNGAQWNALWIKNTVDGSGQTGSTVFDFNGDGIFEVVYRDENTLSIFDGTTGSVLYDVPCHSGTGTEYPVVADVDGDGASEMICGCGDEIRVWSSANQPWVPSREVWNQHMYFNVNINDDLSIPIQQQSHHIVGDSIEMNTFLAQYGDTRFPAADAFVDIEYVTCNKDEFEIYFTICNTGSNILSKNTPLTIYNSDPTTTNANTVKTIQLGENIDIDECIDIVIYIPKSTQGKLYFVINDDGSLTTPYNLQNDFPITSIAECDFTNNIDTISLKYTLHSLELGDDQQWCDVDTTILDAGEGFLSYLWQDGSTNQSLTAQITGWYIVEVLDECDEIHIDSVYISFSYSQSSFDTVYICPGDSIMVFDQIVTDAGDLYKTFSDKNNCDSTVYINVNLREGFIDYQDVKLCHGDSIYFNDFWITKSGNYSYRRTGQDCDSVFQIKVQVLDPIAAESSDTLVCYPTDSSMVTLAISGGVGSPYSVDWGTGFTQDNLSKNLAVGTHHIVIKDEMGCLNELDLHVVNRPRPKIVIKPKHLICYGDSNGQFEIRIDDQSRNWAYSINGSKFSHDFNPSNLSAGTYSFKFKDEYDCVFDTILELNEPIPLDLFLPSDTTIELGQNIDIKSRTNLNEDDLIYSWTPENNLDCIDCSEIVVSPFRTTTYTLRITDKNGCTIIREITIFVKVNWKVYVPNVFSPNGDGLNDGLTIFASPSVKEIISLDIYDRWGELVFRGGSFVPNEPNIGWNGMLNNQAMNPGVYVYVAQIKLLNDEEHHVSGDITLVR